MFIDEVKIYARAGHGGRGCVAFLRETFRPKGGPSGGNGGRGGDVILEADHDLNNLIRQFYEPRLIAESGAAGLGKGMDGRAGKDLIIKVPCGTLVWRADSPATAPSDSPAPENATEEESDPEAPGQLPSILASRPIIRSASGATAIVDPGDPDSLGAPSTSPRASGPKGELVCDLVQHGQRFVLCSGGRGGLGNRNFATSRRQAPRFAQPGEPGSEGHFIFELRTLADVGLVGYPNAGKSTLLTAISKARPKIAPYPFTTLTPQIGIVEYSDWKRLTVCDVPGLIEGAHENVGLGHAFLRHIQRCPVIAIVVDMAGTENRKPYEDYRRVLRELELYAPALLDRPRLVVANKMDEPAAEAHLKDFKRRIRKVPIVPIAAAFDDGIDTFKQRMREIVEQTQAASSGLQLASDNPPR